MDRLSDELNRWLLDRWPWGVALLASGIALVVAALTALYSQSPGAGAAATFVWMFLLMISVIVAPLRRLRRSRGDEDTTDDLVRVAAYVDRQQGSLSPDLRETAVRYAQAQLRQTSSSRQAVVVGGLGLIILAVAVAAAGSLLSGVVTALVLTGLLGGVVHVVTRPRHHRTLQVLDALGAA